MMSETPGSARCVGRRNHAIYGLMILLVVGRVSGTGFACAEGPAAKPGSNPNAGVLTLIDGSRLAGQSQTSSSSVVSWQADGFVDPFQFPVSSVKSLRYQDAGSLRAEAGLFAIELDNRDLILGVLKEWAQEYVTLESPALGKVRVPLPRVRCVHHITKEKTDALGNLIGLQDWSSDRWRRSGWTMDVTDLKSIEAGARLVGDASIPARSVIELDLQWRGPPQFVLSVGIDPNTKAKDSNTGWRFEVWGKTLVAVCERNDVADIRGLLDVTELNGANLIVYLDQIKGRMRVYSDEGKLLGEVTSRQPESEGAGPRNKSAQQVNGETVAPLQPPRGGLSLLCQRGNLAIKQLRIIKWHTEDSEGSPNDQRTIAFTDGSVMKLTSFELNPNTSTVTVSGEGGTVTRPIDDVARITMRGESKPPSKQRSEVTVVLGDGSRLSGAYAGIGPAGVELSVPSLGKSLTVRESELRVLAFNGSQDSVSGSGKPVLSLGDQRIFGDLDESSEAVPGKRGDASVLAWKPLQSRNASRFREDVSGRVSFSGETRDANFTSGLSPAERAKLQVQVRRKAELRGAWQLKAKRATPVSETAPNAVHFRSGDALPCSVQWITEYGVYVQSELLTEETLLPHERIKMIELSGVGSAIQLDSEKKNRLLTLPRLQAASPPTHILVSKTNDFLRCRLLSMDENHVRVELQLEEIELPRERIAKVIWLHPNDMPPVESRGDAPAASEDEIGSQTSTTASGRETEQSDAKSKPVASESERYPGLIQAIRPNGDRVTFRPTNFNGETLVGQSDVLGEVRLEREQIDVILIGGAIAAGAAELPKMQWQLEHATLPLVARDSPTEDLGTGSPLVGLEAPEIDLELLDGGRFRLSQHRGQIVVLDFWASWCAPCMQTMPELEQAMAGYDPSQVRFISVNLQERPAEIQQVLERQELDLTVALDTDGVAAFRYKANAIPQLVVIDAEGRIAQLYVGGGPQVVAAVSATLDEMLSAEGDAS